MPHRPTRALGLSLPLVATTLLMFSATPAQAVDPGRPTEPGRPAGSPHAAPPARPYDFDGRGRPSLVVGAPDLRVGPVEDAGGAVVLRPRAGAAAAGVQVLTQSTAHVPGASERGDAFGASIVSADFDGDGYADLAVAHPHEDVGKLFQAGAVTVFYGSARGLSGRRAIQLTEVGGAREAAAFGSALAVGDLDGDGYPDLAVGAPTDDEVAGSRPSPASGSVSVFSGGGSGLTASGARLLRGQRGTAGYDQGFGSALAVGDLGGDGRVDLVVASGGDGSPDAENYPGSVASCRSATGLPDGCRRLAHDDALAGASSLALGRFSGAAQRLEIAVGVPQNDDERDPGSVQVLTLQGAPATLAVLRRTVLTQRSAGVAGSSGRSSDSFGQALAAGDVDGDGFDDLVVGAPGEQVSGHPSAGRVVLVHGAPGGWRTQGNRSIDESTPGIPGRASSYGFFGAALSLVDRDDDGHLDLAVGAPGKKTGSGTLTTVAGTSGGFSSTGSHGYRLSTLGYPRPARAGFGAAVGR